MGRPAKLSYSLRVAILADLRAGMTQASIAKKHGLSTATIGRVDRDGLIDTAVDREDQTTMEELDALIAERLPTMPQEPRYERGRTLPQVVARGRGVQARERRRDR